MRKLFMVVLLIFMLLATSVPDTNGAGCVTIFMGGDVEGNCIRKHWQVYCGGSGVTYYDTLECY